MEKKEKLKEPTMTEWLNSPAYFAKRAVIRRETNRGEKDPLDQSVFRKTEEEKLRLSVLKYEWKKLQRKNQTTFS